MQRYADDLNYRAKPNTTPLIAYCMRSGHIGFGSKLPSGALPIAKAGTTELIFCIQANARLAYDNKTMLVPGVPEADNEDAAYEAFMKFRNRIGELLGRHTLDNRAELEARPATA